MPTNRIGFKQFLNISKNEEDLKIVLDTNALIAFHDENHSDHERITDFILKLDKINKPIFYTTITTKAEFLDYERRRLLTEGLFDLRQDRESKISEKAKVAIDLAKARRNKRQSDEQKKSLENLEHLFDISVSYFFDREIKDIKKSFRAKDINEVKGWISVCRFILKNQLIKSEDIIDEFCEYLSPHKSDQGHLFIDMHIDWKKATSISAETGMSFSDSLILNMLNHSTIKYILSLDFDMVYGTAVSAKNKFVILPDNKLSNYKKILKGVNIK